MPDTPDERTKLQTAVSDLAKRNEVLNARMKEVGEKIGQLNAHKPSVGDRFRDAFRPKKSTPMAKLSDEREQIMQEMSANQRERDAATRQLDVLKKAEAQAKVRAEEVSPTTPRTTVGETLRQKNAVQKSPSEVSVSGPQINSPGVSQGEPVQSPPEPQVKGPGVSQNDPLRSPLSSSTYTPYDVQDESQGVSQKQDPLRSPLHSSAYAPSLSQEEPTTVSQQQDPLRSPLHSSAYAPSLSQEEPTTVSQQQDPLRSPLNSSGYAPYLSQEEPTTVSQQQDPLRSPLNPSGYAPYLSREESSRVSGQQNPLRSDVPDPYQVVDEQSDPSKTYDVVLESPSVSQEDPLRSVTSKSYDVIDEQSDPSKTYDVVLESPGVSQDDPLRSVGPKSYDVIGEGGPGDLQDELAPEMGLGQEGPEVPGSPKFKMKPMLDRYVEGEKNAPSKKTKVGGKETEVHEKEWLLETVNEKRRTQGKPDLTKEEWEKSGLAGMQARTQYFNEEQRTAHEVNMEGGVVKNGAEKLKEGNHVFVMDGEGQVYAKKESEGYQKDELGRQAHVHHSSFLAGEEVAGAGELQIGKDGVLKGVTDRSGHYKPGEEQTKQTLEQIDQHGASLDNVKFTLDRGTEKTGGMAREFLQGQVTPEEQQHRAERQAAGGSVGDTSKVMEQTFKGRHNVADQIKAKGESVRDSLRKTDNLNKIEGAPKPGLGRVH